MVWLKANSGVTHAGDGSAVTAWNDASTNTYNMSDVGNSSYIYKEQGLNFNPTIDNPDGSNRRMENTTALSVREVNMVSIPDNPDNCDGIFGERNADAKNIRTCE